MKDVFDWLAFAAVVVLVVFLTQRVVELDKQARSLQRSQAEPHDDDDSIVRCQKCWEVIDANRH